MNKIKITKEGLLVQHHIFICVKKQTKHVFKYDSVRFINNREITPIPEKREKNYENIW